jgi:hypothetical protein
MNEEFFENEGEVFSILNLKNPNKLKPIIWEE